MSQIVLVLGAGSTLANAVHFHGERYTGTNPPLDYTFFDRIRTLRIQPGTELRQYASGHPYLNPFSGGHRVRAEEFFRDLFADFQEATSGDSTIAAYEQLLSAYLRVLRETTNWMSHDNRRGGPVGRLIAAAAAGWDRVTVLTFNHDLVIENEIQKRARLTAKWCLDEGYGTFSQSSRVTGRTTDSLSRHSPTCQHSISILKLHGSLNWNIRMRGRHPSPRILSGEADPPEILVSPRRTLRSQLLVNRKARSGGGRTRWYTWPVVIPPVHGKEALIRRLVPSVWDDAAMALADADRMVFFGYSLPELDIRAHRLLQKGISRNQRMDSIDVVNPDPLSAGRYAAILQPPSLRWQSSVADFLQRGGLDPEA